jgi:hypothetical protein
MNYPRTHIFVDAQCPELAKGQLTTWSRPGNLVAVIGPYQTNLSPQDAYEIRAIRDVYRSYEFNTPEVHIIIEGLPSSNLWFGLSSFVRDVIYIKDEKISAQIEIISDAIARLDDLNTAHNHLEDAGDALICSLNETVENLNSSVVLDFDPLSGFTEHWLESFQSSVNSLVDEFMEVTKAHMQEALVDGNQKAA